MTGAPGLIAKAKGTQMTNYADILNTSWDNIPTPKILPAGSWRVRCKSASQQAPKGDGNASILFVYEPVEPMDDVDDNAIEALGPNYDYSIAPIFVRFWLGGAAELNRVRDHIAKHGIDLTGMTVGETLKALQGTEVVGMMAERAYTNKATGETSIENVLTSFTELR